MKSKVLDLIISRKLDLILISLLILSLIPLAIASIEDGNVSKLDVQTNETLRFDCIADIAKDKTFIAETEIINVGMACSDNANVILYACDDENCENYTYETFASKINGKLARVNGFEIGNKYHYECYECMGGPVLIVNHEEIYKEGDLIDLDVSCIDSKGQVSDLSFSNWMNSNRKQIDFESAGKHLVTVTCEDSNGMLTSKDIIITVENVNLPPVILDVVNS